MVCVFSLDDFGGYPSTPVLGNFRTAPYVRMQPKDLVWFAQETWGFLTWIYPQIGIPCAMFRKVEFQPFDMIHDKQRVLLLNNLLKQWKTGGSLHVLAIESARFKIIYPPNNIRLPSGKHLHNYGKSPCWMGKLTINGPCSIVFCMFTRPGIFLQRTDQLCEEVWCYCWNCLGIYC